MTGRERRFDSMSGAATHYARLPVAQYGSRGRATTFYCANTFFNKLEACFTELWQLCPFGPAEVVVSAGAYVDKPGLHGQGRAIDVDAIFWPCKEFVALRFDEDPMFYLAVESLLHQYFGIVLAYYYDNRHRDHFHVDDSHGVGLRRGARTHTLYVQCVCRYLLGLAVDIDGDWGSQTEAGVRQALELLEIDGPIDTHWIAFLKRAADTGFEKSTVAMSTIPVGEATPAALLRAIYVTTAEHLGDHPGRNAVEAAITVFANHPDIAALLEPGETGGCHRP